MPITTSKKSSRKPAARASSRPASSRTAGHVRVTPRKSYQPSVRSAPEPAPKPPSLLGQISAERRMDILGVFLAIVGLLTLVSLFSASNGGVTGAWIGGLKNFLGWGVYIFAVARLVLGAWLVARDVERLPSLNVERVVGIILLFVVLLVIFAGLGNNGGTAGAVIELGFVNGLGGPGAVILVIAWLLVALAMTLDLSMHEMFKWTAPIIQRVKERLNQSAQKQAMGSTGLSGSEPPVPAEGPGLFGKNPPDEFTPLTRVPVAQSAVAQPQGVTIKTGLPAAPVMSWTLPKVADILEPPMAPKVNEEFIEKRARLIEETLASFGAPSQVVEISRGPTVTMFGVEPLFVESRTGQTRVRVGKISSLADDLALALAAPRIRIQAPVPGRGYVGIEVPNEEMSLVALREVVESEVFTRSKAPLRFALGKDVAGHPKMTSLEVMPHLLIAGTTGSGKSVCVNSILTCFLLHNTPDDLRLILVDPKRVELTGYNGVPHLLAPVVVEIERVIGALQWMTREMDNRYHKFAEAGARNIGDYNARVQSQGGKKLPHLVIIIDELADLMMIAPDETERTITRLAQLARATGIHMILATQRPSVDVVTGLIKANFPARIAFAVASNTDSRVILDQPGAERLLGRGDMLFQAPDAPAPVRLQGVFVSDIEINRLVEYWRTLAGTAGSPYAAAGTPNMSADILPAGIPLKQVPMFEDITAVQGDPLLNDAIDICRREGRCSVSMLQRKLRIGYTRSARLVDTMAEKGIVGSPEPGTGVRQVLDYGPAAPPKEE